MPFLRKILSRFKALIKHISLPKAPNSISKNFRTIDVKGVEEITASLKRHYFTRQIWGETAISAETWLSSNEGKNDLLDHLYRRLENFRQTVIPWLSDAKPLSGASILEIGCGTGSSTVALAEQGAKVVGVDIDEGSLIVARDRCKVYGLNVDFFKINATQVHQYFSNQHFDFVIFFACLEHMTLDERIAAMRNTWNMLSKDDLWCVIDTPNRLWYFDDHTSLLPFYSWLPDNLAFMYSQFSPRQPFCNSYRKYSEDSMLSFLRHGRGISFHEFDLAIKKTEYLNVISSLPIYLRQRSLFKILELGRRITPAHQYESFLARVEPNVHKGFYTSNLNLIIKKD